MIVEWKATALDRLADIYVQLTPAERDELEREVVRINSALADDPYDLGESREPRHRTWFSRRLMVYFSISSAAPLVNVLYVVRTRRPLPDDEDE